MSQQPTIIYTKTDEAPALATYSFLPIARAFARTVGVELELRDISLAGRILAQFSDRLSPAQRVSHALSELGEMTQSPLANIIKLPNISASVPQLQAAVKELQARGYDVPDLPTAPQTPEEKEIAARYDRVKGSAVNPVLREGNSDRRAPRAVKEYARRHPHSMGAWSGDSRSHVATMTSGDFRSNEASVTTGLTRPARASSTSTPPGRRRCSRTASPFEAGEVVDGTFMSVAPCSFLDAQVEEARESGLLFSLHMKATMMKVSDPIIFGHAVRSFFKPVFDKPMATTLDALGVT